MSTRTLVCLFFGFVLVTVGGWLSRNVKGEEDESKPSVATQSNADVVVVDGEAVFQRAFWRRAGADDKILNAERREWMNEEQVTRWQWFLEVKPSKELLTHLRKKNAFNLSVTAYGSKDWINAPSWFQPAEPSSYCLSAPDGEMTLIFEPQRILATGRGGGFHQGSEAPLPESQPPAREPSGRLPNHSPPLVK